MRRLWLINPGRRGRVQWDMQEICELMGKRTTSVPLALPLLAALTPSRYEIRIIDEDLEPLSLASERFAPDVVGITAWYSTIARGYEIADAFRRRGVTVVMGGPQVSFSVARSLEHCDAVVIGEAEGVWEQLLDDLERGTLRRTYQAERPSEFRSSPPPRWDLIDTAAMMTTPVQVSRGCPNRCRFCCVSRLFGKVQRYREVDDVIAELRSAPVKEIAFADDNLMADRDYADELLEKMTPLGLSFSCQSSLEVGLDTDRLGRMAAAGCRTILFGFESTSTASLSEANKRPNVVESYQEVIENVHRAGIHVLASFLVGFDADGPEIFEAIGRFVRRHNLSFVMVNALSPFPGTALHRSLERSDRLLPMDPDRLVLFYPMMRYRHLAPDEVAERGLELLREIYSYEQLLDKGPAVIGNGAFLHDDGDRIAPWVKLRSTVALLWSHLVTGDAHKRRLFLELFQLVRQQRAAPGDVVRYLLFMASQQGFLEDAARQMPASIAYIRRRMAMVDVGRRE